MKTLFAMDRPFCAAVQRIAKAAGPPPGTEEEAVHQLTELDVPYVSLVDRGANRETRFLMVKVEDTAKAVPDADASNEDKRAAQAARSTEYGIQVLEANSNLSYPAGDPTTERLYGDPVNLKYPVGYEDNEPSAERARNALARFKQNAGVYTEEASRGRVYARIVEAALALDIAVSYDPEDPVDALLPAALRERLTAAQAKAAVAAWCVATAADLETTLRGLPLVKAADPPPETTPSPADEVAALRRALAAEQAARAAQATALDEARAALRKAHLATTRRHQGTVSAPSGLVPPASARPPAPASGTSDAVRRWRSGQPMSPSDPNKGTTP